MRTMVDPTERYQNWLRDLVEKPSPFYQILFDMAWETPYEWFVPNDDNRAEDGLNLRNRFELETSIKLPNLGDCRMLEFLIALAIRMNEATYQYDDPNKIAYWFWQLVSNMHMDRFDDFYSYYRIRDDIAEGFERLNARKYHYDGSNGGLFPLENPVEDQREVEIWYQMMAYLQETM